MNDNDEKVELLIHVIIDASGYSPIKIKQHIRAEVGYETSCRIRSISSMFCSYLAPLILLYHYSH